MAAYDARGFGPRTACEIAQRINGVVPLGVSLGVTTGRIGVLEAALNAAGVDFEVEIHSGEPDWGRLIDLLARTINPIQGQFSLLTADYLGPHNP